MKLVTAIEKYEASNLIHNIYIYIYIYIVSERGFTSEQCKKVIYGRVKHGKRRNNREE